MLGCFGSVTSNPQAQGFVILKTAKGVGTPTVDRKTGGAKTKETAQSGEGLSVIQ